MHIDACYDATCVLIDSLADCFISLGQMKYDFWDKDRPKAIISAEAEGAKVTFGRSRMYAEVTCHNFG